MAASTSRAGSVASMIQRNARPVSAPGSTTSVVVECRWPPRRGLSSLIVITSTSSPAPTVNSGTVRRSITDGFQPVSAASSTAHAHASCACEEQFLPGQPLHQGSALNAPNARHAAGELATPRSASSSSACAFVSSPRPSGAPLRYFCSRQRSTRFAGMRDAPPAVPPAGSGETAPRNTKTSPLVQVCQLAATMRQSAMVKSPECGEVP